LPGYLDGALSAAEQNETREHLLSCPACRAQVDGYRRISALMARAERPAVPVGLVTRIRIAVDRTRQAEPWTARAWSRISLTFQNFLAPFALPTTGGVLGALVVFAFMSQSMIIGLPLGAVPNDVPLNLIRPAEVDYLAPFPLSPAADDGKAFDDHVIVEAVLDAVGQAVSYEILAGPRNLQTRRQLDQVVFFSKFRPQTSFGRPEAGGRVVLSFREIRVKG
jgi:hypothetical protein